MVESTSKGKSKRNNHIGIDAGNTIRIGSKKLINYLLAIQTALNRHPTVIIASRGKAMSTALTATQIIISKGGTILDAKYVGKVTMDPKQMKLGTEMLKSKTAPEKDVEVTCLEITLVRPK